MGFGMIVKMHPAKDARRDRQNFNTLMNQILKMAWYAASDKCYGDRRD